MAKRWHLLVCLSTPAWVPDALDDAEDGMSDCAGASDGTAGWWAGSGAGEAEAGSSSSSAGASDGSAASGSSSSSSTTHNHSQALGLPTLGHVQAAGRALRDV
jgi:hypothetical protein